MKYARFASDLSQAARQLLGTMNTGGSTMLVGMNDVLVAQEHSRDLLKEAEAHRAEVMRTGNRPLMIAGHSGAIAGQALRWLGSQFVNAGEGMQRRYAD